MPELAIFAGRGVLPQEIYHHMPDALVVSFRSVGIDFDAKNQFEAQFEKAGALFKRLRLEGVKKICFAGAITRPQLSLWRMDFKTFRMMPKIREAIAHSDGDALKIIRALVEAEGFEVVGAQSIAPELLATEGQMGKIEVPVIDYGKTLEIHAAMSELDIGQALVMRDGQCIAIETLPGTKAMLEFVARHGGQGGYLFKSSKAGQDLDMDMASIGLSTVAEAKASNLDGIVLGAGRSLILQKPEVIKACDEAGLFLTGVSS